MKAIIIDDEILNIKSLQIDLEAYCSEVQIVGVAQTVPEGLSLINKQQPDLIFLDVQIHDQTAFDILPLIDTEKMKVILVTAFNHFGIQAIKYGVVDYLLKPINTSELILAVKKISSKLGLNSTHHILQNEFLQVHFKGFIQLIKHNDIAHLEASGTYTHIHLVSKEKIVSSKSLHVMEENLPNKFFLRVHNSFIINIQNIEKIIKSKYGSLLLKNGIEIPISASKRKHVAAVLGLH